LPLISSFFSVLIYIFKEQNNPHVHAVYAGEKMSITDGEILAGKLPRKQMKNVEAWVALCEDEINAAWIVLNENVKLILSMICAELPFGERSAETTMFVSTTTFSTVFLPLLSEQLQFQRLFPLRSTLSCHCV